MAYSLPVIPPEAGRVWVLSRPQKKALILRKIRAFFILEHFVYIIQSLKDHTLYKGYSNDPHKRLIQHNAGESRYTSMKIPWKLVYIEKCDNKTEALQREKTLKRANSNYIKWLIEQPINILNNWSLPVIPPQAGRVRVSSRRLLKSSTYIKCECFFYGL